jgi:hypothetical protein
MLNSEKVYSSTKVGVLENGLKGEGTIILETVGNYQSTWCNIEEYLNLLCQFNLFCPIHTYIMLQTCLFNAYTSQLIFLCILWPLWKSAAHKAN